MPGLITKYFNFFKPVIDGVLPKPSDTLLPVNQNPLNVNTPIALDSRPILNTPPIFATTPLVDTSNIGSQINTAALSVAPLIPLSAGNDLLPQSLTDEQIHAQEEKTQKLNTLMPYIIGGVALVVILLMVWASKK